MRDGVHASIAPKQIACKVVIMAPPSDAQRSVRKKAPLLRQLCFLHRQFSTHLGFSTGNLNHSNLSIRHVA
jgi:hypothetical protein